MRQEPFYYVMLFCSLMLVRNRKATLQQALEVTPLLGGAEKLAGKLVDGGRFMSHQGVDWTPGPALHNK